MPRVAVRLCSLIRNITFPVFKGIQGAGIHINIGIQFLYGYPVAPGLKQAAQ